MYEELIELRGEMRSQLEQLRGIANGAPGPLARELRIAITELETARFRLGEAMQVLKPDSNPR